MSVSKKVVTIYEDEDGKTEAEIIDNRRVFFIDYGKATDGEYREMSCCGHDIDDLIQVLAAVEP